MDPLLDQLKHRAFPELADAMRSQSGDITLAWDKLVREILPQLDRLTFEQLKDSVPQVLAAIADAIASDDPQAIEGVLAQSPKQGLARFHQNYTVTEIMQEDRLLRGVIVVYVERALGRQMNAPEAAALHATVDVMLQQAVVALVDEQKAKLRAAAETELKYLAFLSHDLNNNLSSVTLMLKLLRDQLVAASLDQSDAARTVDNAQQAIHQTIAGMQRLLEHERLRRSHNEPQNAPVDLNALAAAMARQFEREAEKKGVKVAAASQAGAVVHSDEDLIRLVLQNILGNAVKYTSAGTVRVGVEQQDDKRWVLSVSDEGPGIGPEDLKRIFDAFQRGEVHGQKGVGLGLAIASQAAKLLGAELTVQSTPGVGSTFSLILPAQKADGKAGRRESKESLTLRQKR